jgi:hypothetical protein
MRIHWLMIFAGATFLATGDQAKACAQTQAEAGQACSTWSGCQQGSSLNWSQAAYYSCVAACVQRTMCPTAAKKARDRATTVSGGTPPKPPAPPCVEWVRGQCDPAAKKARDKAAKLPKDLPVATKEKTVGQRATSSAGQKLGNASPVTTSGTSKMTADTDSKGGSKNKSH